MDSPPSLREMLDALAAAELLAVANALGVYQEVVTDLGPETALYQGLIEAEILGDIDVELAVIEDLPLRLAETTDYQEGDVPGSPNDPLSPHSLLDGLFNRTYNDPLLDILNEAESCPTCQHSFTLHNAEGCTLPNCECTTPKGDD